MARRAILLLILLSTSVVGMGYILSDENRSGFQWLTSLSPGKSSVPTEKADAPSTAKAAAIAATAKPPADDALGYMLASVAEQYTQTTRYPAWSVPLTPAQAKAYQGNKFEPVSLPLEGDGQFIVTLEKYRFTRGETILVVAVIQGPQVVARSLTATLEKPASREAVASTSLEQAGKAVYFEGSLEASEAPGEYRLIVEARLDGRPVRHASPLTIEPYLGEFKGLGDPHVSDNNLVIPIKFSPEEPGFYALSAQLYAGQRPVAQLQTEQRLDGTSDTIKLKAHGTVLANETEAGQLQLKHIQIRQLPAKPGDRTNYGFGPDKGYEFTPPALDDLTDTPAVDPESEQRAALLRQLADKF